MKRRTSGFTLMEVVMAATITTLVGLAVAGASMALSSATSEGEDYYNCMQTGRSAMRQVRNAVQGARLVLAVRDDKREMAYWVGDADGSGTINLTELRIIRHNNDNTVIEYRVAFPETWDVSMRKAMDVDSTLNAAMSLPAVEDCVVNSSYKAARTIASDVSSLAFSTPSAVPLVRLMRIVMTVSDGGQTLTLRGAAALRAPATSFVTPGDPGFVLSMPLAPGTDGDG